MPVLDVEHRSIIKRGSLELPAVAVRSTVPRWLRGLVGPLVSRLGWREWRRRIWHMSPGLLPLLLWPIPHADPISPEVLVIVSGIAAVAAGRIVLQYRHISRRSDDSWESCVPGYLGSVMGALLLFRSAPEIAFAALAILAFGDGSATLGGKVFRGPALPWNPQKTWSGLLSFLVVAAPLASLIFWRETHNLKALSPGVSFGTAFLCCGAAVLLAALVESLRSRLNDNIRVGITAVVMLAVMKSCLIGWD